jgi:hypothetical protein
MKIIFLDIDWVLIPNFNHEEIDQEWNVECCDNLVEIIESTNAKIVISSSWRHNIKNLKKAWLKAWLDEDFIIWVTPSKTWWGRDEEIKQYLEWQSFNPYYMWLDYISWHKVLTWRKDVKWIAIDDEYFAMKKTDKMWKLVRTKIGTGLDKKAMNEAIRLLNI